MRGSAEQAQARYFIDELEALAAELVELISALEGARASRASDTEYRVRARRVELDELRRQIDALRTRFGTGQ